MNADPDKDVELMEDSRQPFPRARRRGLVTCEVAGELLVYDLEQDKAHCLNSTAARVWRRCDGRTSVPEITRDLNRTSRVTLETDVVWFVLGQLKRAQLLGLPVPEEPNTGDTKLTRRELIKRAGIGAAIGFPLVRSIVTPTAVEAATCRPPGASCGPDGHNGTCCSGFCVLGVCT